MVWLKGLAVPPWDLAVVGSGGRKPLGIPRERESGCRAAAAAVRLSGTVADRAEETAVVVDVRAGVVLLADWPLVLEPAEDAEVYCSSDGMLERKEAAVETADAMLVAEVV